jgi:hypothetical protein
MFPVARDRQTPRLDRTPQRDTGTRRRSSHARARLVVSEVNPRYFTVEGDREAVYLTGSHIWNNFHDGLGPGGACAEEPEYSTTGPT